MLVARRTLTRTVRRLLATAVVSTVAAGVALTVGTPAGAAPTAAAESAHATGTTAHTAEWAPTTAATALTDESAPATAAAAHTVGYDRYSFTIDGQRMYLWSAEFHYWRLPSPSLWRDVLQKLKAGGYNAVSIYFHWGFHSPRRGVYDFTGLRDVDLLLDIAEEVGIYVLARPGPYINAETDAGGLPSWLVNSPARERSNEADYIAAVDEWLDAIYPIIARHQLTNGTGTVILYQNENEFGSTDPGAVAYMQHLQDRARAGGITVPTFHNELYAAAKWVPGTPGAPDLYAFDAYPLGFDCSNPTFWPPVPDLSGVRAHSPDGPLFTAEFQGGSFDYWAGRGTNGAGSSPDPGDQRGPAAHREVHRDEGVGLLPARGHPDHQDRPAARRARLGPGRVDPRAAEPGHRHPVPHRPARRFDLDGNGQLHLRGRRRGRGVPECAAGRRGDPGGSGFQDPGFRIRPGTPAAGLLHIGDLHPPAARRPRPRGAARPARPGRRDHVALPVAARRDGAVRSRRHPLGRRAATGEPAGTYRLAGLPGRPDQRAGVR